MFREDFCKSDFLLKICPKEYILPKNQKKGVQKHISGDNTTIYKNLTINSSSFLTTLELYAILVCLKETLSPGVLTHSGPEKRLCPCCLSFLAFLFLPKTNNFGEKTQFLNGHVVV